MKIGTSLHMPISKNVEAQYFSMRDLQHCILIFIGTLSDPTVPETGLTLDVPKYESFLTSGHVGDPTPSDMQIYSKTCHFIAMLGTKIFHHANS